MKVGDPSELDVISKTFESARKPGHNIRVGSVKPNVSRNFNGASERMKADEIGHLEANAGLASLINRIHILGNAIIPPNIRSLVRKCPRESGTSKSR